jgi:hypothetical protein
MILGTNYTLVTKLTVSSLLVTDVSVYMKAPSSSTFELLTIAPENFVECARGYYNIVIPKEKILELGTYVFSLEGLLIVTIEEKRECLPAPIGAIVPPNICIVRGNVLNIAAQSDAIDRVAINARPIALPNNQVGSYILGKDIVAYADYSGAFQLPLIRGMTVIVEIKSAGVRFQAVVPDLDTVRLEDLEP